VTDAPTMLEAILAGLENHGLVGPDAALPGFPDMLSWHLKVLPAFGDVVARIDEPIMLVLDDVTGLDSAHYEALLDSVLHSLPPGSVVCAATRGAVPRAFRQRRLHGNEVELTASELVFSLGETEQLLSGLGVVLPADDLHDIWEKCEGWPALLYLCGLALRQGARVQSIGLPDTVADYLRDVVMDPLSPETADFLLRSSVLQELTAPLCSPVTGREDSAAILDELARRLNLVRPLDETRTRFGMHSMLSTFLQQELRTHAPTEWTQAQRAACQAHVAAGDAEDALRHAVLAADDDLVTAIVWPAAPMLLISGRMPVLRRWLDIAGPDRLARIPELAVASSWVAQHHGDMTAMSHDAALAERLCAEQGRDELRGHLDLLQCSIAADGIESMERAAEAAMLAFPPPNPVLAVALYHLGAARYMLGRPEQAVSVLETARRMAEVQDQHVMHAIIAAELGLARLETGRTQAAVDALDEARHVLRHHVMDTAMVAVIPYAASAYGYALEGRSAETTDHLRVGLRLVSRLQGPAPWFAVRAFAQLALAALVTGDAGQAKDLLRTAKQHYGRASACPMTENLLVAVQQRLATVADLDQLPEGLTLAETRVLQYLPTHLSFPDIADDLVVSRFTVKTQAMAIYRKLGVHSRREAVQTARTLGLLPPA
jgi:LuxR family maltose regulon positive regulatory protein